MLKEKIYFSDLLYRMETFTLYKDIVNDAVVNNFNVLLQAIVSDTSNINILAVGYYDFIRSLIAVAEEKGYSGNIWKKHILSLFLEAENTFTILCERTPDVKNMSIYQYALSDAKTLKILMEVDIENICENLGHGENVSSYTPVITKELGVLDQVEYTKDADKILDLLILDYNTVGSGKLGASSLFRYDWNYKLTPILDRVNSINMKDFIGYSDQKSTIIANTDAFIRGDHAENCLLIGNEISDMRSLLASLIDKYANEKLKFIEIPSDHTGAIIEMLHDIKSRNMNFIILIEGVRSIDGDTCLRQLLGKSFEKRPSNILVYATTSEEIFKQYYGSFATLEKISKDYDDYFELPIYFSGLKKAEYLSLVKLLANKRKISIGEEFLAQQALEWEPDKILSIEKAEKFINHILWEMKYH